MIYFIHSAKGIISEHISNASIQDALDYFLDKKVIQIDTETEGFDPHLNELLLVQLGDKENQFVIEPTKENLQALKPMLENEDKLFIFTNAKFDLRFLLRNGIDVKSIFDIFLAECVLTTGLKNEERDLSLQGMGLKYLNIHIDKTERGNIHRGLTEKVVIYAADDVKHMQSIYELQLERLKEYSLENITELENKVVRVLAKMEYRGINFNPEIWSGVSEETKKQLADLEQTLDGIVYDIYKEKGTLVNELTKFINVYKQGNMFFEEDIRKVNINWSSNQQKLELLRTLGVNITSVGDEILQKNKFKHSIVPQLINYSKTSKLVTSFGTAFLKHINHVTKRIHGEHWQILATGRLAMSSPNIQQIPGHGELAKKIRSSFVKTPGYKLVCADYSGFELAIIAEFSQDPVWINTLNNGGDLHGELCSMTFDIPMSDIRKPFPHKPTFTYRDVQKTIDFGLAYGMSEYKLSDTIQVDVKEARKIIKKFFKVVPQVDKFLKGLGIVAKMRGYIATPEPFKRIRWFPKWEQRFEDYANIYLSSEDFKILGEIERAGKNTPIQGTNANLIKYALVKLQEEIDENRWDVYLLLSVHDEILSEAEESIAEDWAKVQSRIMIECAKKVLTTVPISAEAKISDYWEK
jgi:DNA polymerase-1